MPNPLPYKLYILDLDGTVYRGAQVLPGAPEATQGLRARGARIRFVTNNSRVTPQTLVEKLSGMGIEAAPQEVLSSGMAAASYLESIGLASVFVVGESGFVESLQAKGLRVVNAGAEGGTAQPEGVADAVAVGIDRAFTYDKLNAAMQQLLSGAKFVATNCDATYPVENGRMVPGAGSIVAAIRSCVGIEPILVGKPEPFMLELLLAETGCLPTEVLAVGDRLETDIAWAHRLGCASHLVLTGVTESAPPGQAHSANLMGLLK